MDKNFRVLITDDDKDIHEVLKSSFQYIFQSKPKDSLKLSLLDQLNSVHTKEKSNVDLVHAYQGREALEIISNGNEPDLLILDMMMPPGINGAQVLEELKEKSKDLKIIISTAYFHDLESDIKKASQYFDKVFLLQKPYDLETFSNLVKNLLFQQNNELNHKQILQLK